jgi:hypothetical protein
MNKIRMFAFVASVLVTAFLFRVIAYDLTAPQHAEAGTAQHAGVPGRAAVQ